MLSKVSLTLLLFSGLLNAEDKRPNILWIFAEDLNPFMSCYGVKENPTPNIDRLAENGVLYEKAFTPSPVCSPARSSLITGMMSTSINAHNHHSSRTVESGNFLKVPALPELFREAGYFTFNQGKDDYNFIYDREAFYTGEVRLHYWYTFSGGGSWKDPDRKQGQPFFGQIQINGGKYALKEAYLTARLTPEERIDPTTVTLPPYYPDIPSVRKDWANHYDTARITDKQIGRIIAELEEDGELENTIIFFFSDHGYKGARHKQFCYDGGLQVPLIIANFGSNELIERAKRVPEIAALLDVSATSLVLAGIQLPAAMESRNLLDPNNRREFVISTRDRCDFTIDRIRSVRTEDFHYIRNFMPERPYSQLSYRHDRPEIKEIIELAAAGGLDEIQMQWYGNQKPEEELYDVANDPHQIHNLAEDPAYQSELAELRMILTNWIEESGDMGEVSETKTLKGIENLRFIKSRWEEKCINPEYQILEDDSET